MPSAGRRHRLILYTYIIDLFWRSIFAVGIALLVLVAAYTWLPAIFPQYTLPQVTGLILWLTAGVGAFAILIAFFLLVVRKSAYVQPCDTHLRLVTPFVRMTFPYDLFLKTSSIEMLALFSLKDLKGQTRTVFRKMAGRTAVVLELKNWPLPRRVIEQFLYPLFFPDQTSRLALIVPDWMRFSTELESFRSTWLETIHHPAITPHAELLASISRKR
jgi:hypothetical protein